MHAELTTSQRAAGEEKWRAEELILQGIWETTSRLMMFRATNPGDGLQLTE